MRFSIFTPTNNTEFLPALRDSLVEQTFKDFEWVLVANGDASVEGVMTAISMPDGLPFPARIIHSRLRGVGALKAFACSKCQGDYLVEVDHDDLLVETALEKIDTEITASDADFLYSDSAEFRADGSPSIYGKEWGWEHDLVSYKGKPYVVNKAFPLNARSLSEIFYAPNHVRVWRKDTYQTVGGHNPQLEICDDFDLVLRTYLLGSKFHHIPECLYLYRIRGDAGNTWLKRNADIQTEQQRLSDIYRLPLIKEWCRREGLPLYDLGGAINRAEGFLSVDMDESADVVCDLERGLPFANDSVGCFRASDFLEHIRSCPLAGCDLVRGAHLGCTITLMNEIYRCLVPGGWLITRTPSTDGRGAFQDFTHASHWNRNSWFYFTRKEQQKYVKGIKCGFQGARIWDGFPGEWEKTHAIPYIHADLVALKGQRVAGMVEI